MDQSVIEKLKIIYRKQVLRRLLLAENNEESVAAFCRETQYERRLLHVSRSLGLAQKPEPKKAEHAINCGQF
ncbi:hypothetical protein TNCV_1595411 [Trichonephila clavipes]|nr:hypothetical protein TNCV_1595411 [Trichonephila clavipes]